jgi:hypothetical protein
MAFRNSVGPAASSINSSDAGCDCLWAQATWCNSELMAIGAELTRGVRSITDLVVFDEEEITEDILLARAKATVEQIEAMARHYNKAQEAKEKLVGIDQKKHPKRCRRCRWKAGRELVAASRAVRKSAHWLAGDHDYSGQHELLPVDFPLVSTTSCIPAQNPMSR